ncbi:MULTISPECIES: hypothetical protein [Protofrankia]|uniref:PLL-like beta propeller domain-containing protein n=1 Tax=Candidatus Protofrankia datiscae TaxID=2716812 RepID=F8B3P6_9ACTN|nr:MULTISPECIES: hypothetical protein [Protofrankia]AEH07887.1 hypothetical protein FsymDg_0317 [Candidatus Protofrankia datiscae]
MAISTTPGTNWGTWINLEGSFVDVPSAVLNADNRVSVFVQGGSNTLWSRYEQRDRAWAGWMQHPGSRVAGAPNAIRGKDGKIRVFYRTPDNHIEVITQNAINGGFGAPVDLISNVGGDPAAALNADGRIQVFFRGSDDALWYIHNQGLLYEQYTPPASLGGAIYATPSPALDGSGRIVVAVKGGSDTLYTIQQKSWNSADAWEAFSSETTGVTSRPTVTLDASAHVQIFYRGSDGAAWRVGQRSDYDSFETSVSLRGQILGEPTAFLGQDGRVHAFVKGANEKALWVAVQQTENQPTYFDFQNLGGVIGDVHPQAVIANSENLLYVFVQGSGTPKSLWLLRQVWA